MAVAPTGNIFKALSFDNVSSRTYGVYITGEAVYNAPERDVEMVEIPGRNGSFALDKGRFQNIEVSYPAGIFADSETDFAEAVSDFRNFLCSRNGYVRLTDEYNPNEYRMAIYKSGLEVSPAQLKAGEFSIVFDCKPQRWLTSGEEVQTMGVWGDTETAEGAIATFTAEDGDGVKSLVADIVPIQSGAGDPSPNNVRPITGHTQAKVSRTGKNLSAINTGTNNAVIANVKAGQTYTFSLYNSGACGFNLKKNTNSGAVIKTQTSAVSERLYQTFTPDEDCDLFLNGFGSGGYVFTNCASNYQLELGSTATTYEPYNGTTYTVSFSSAGTVYGGTVDIVSGELTVTHKSIDLGGYNWDVSGNGNYYTMYNATISSEIKRPTSTSTMVGVKCSCYVENATDRLYDASVDYSIAVRSTNGNIWVRDTTNGTSGANLKTFLAGKTLVYELATPLTYTLTPTQVSLLIGTNNVWSDTGDVSVEYGRAPNVVVNPTLFDSSPLLETTGYGTIGFNGYEIELSNDLMADVLLEVKGEAYLTNPRVISFNENHVNTGDVMRFSRPPYHDIVFYNGGYSGSGTITYTDSNPNITDISSLGFAFDGETFTVGTSKTLTNTRTYTTSAYPAESATYTATVVYDGAHTFTFSASLTSSTHITFTSPTLNGKVEWSWLYATTQAYGLKTFIDCDLGEAYAIKDGAVISLNQYIDLGSDLPTFAPGASVVSYENTITNLKIQPRWWKV